MRARKQRNKRSATYSFRDIIELATDIQEDTLVRLCRALSYLCPSLLTSNDKRVSVQHAADDTPQRISAQKLWKLRVNQEYLAGHAPPPSMCTHH